MAGAFAASAAAGTVGNLATEYASPYISYFFRYGEIVEDFNRLRNQLDVKEVRVKNDVEEAKRQTEVIEKDVQEWLARTEKELGEAKSLAAEIERINCFSWCPSWGWRYCLSKKVAKKTLDISKLLETGEFQRVGQRAPLEGIEWVLSENVMYSESLISSLKRIMKAFESDVVSMIGVHGMPGVGKTTLAKEVGKQARKKRLFDKVVIFTMSQTPDISKIQDKIAEIFGLEFKAKTEEGRAEELLRRLKEEKKILIIVDDIWDEFKLETIGIPVNGEHKGCKFLLTTRLEQVCIQMNCQERFQLNILSEDEAWALFKDIVGLKDVSPALNDVAKEVARECNGLPLAIVAIGKALQGESLAGWIAANQRLKKSGPLNNQDVCKRLYSRLELSYDYLREEMRSCFLLCSLFSEDADISIEMLIVCGIGQGLFYDTDLMEEQRREIRVALTRLQKSGLLLETDDEDSVRMHDVVRDFAHWITSKEENKFLVKDGLTEWPTSESFRYCTTISLWNCKISNLPDNLEFTKLKTLFLMGESSLLLPSMIFKGMKALRVLFLKHVVLLIDALQFLTDLRTLWFENCQLENISSLRNMKSLEILGLHYANVNELPEELVELQRLKSLYFSGKKIPTNLLSRLTSLQELYVGESNFNISELNSLSRLTTLTLSVSTDEWEFQENFVFPKLQRYNIGVNWSCIYMPRKTLRTLTIRHISSSLLSAFKELFCNVKALTLVNISEYKNIVPNIDRGGLNELTSLELYTCKDLECLIDATREQGPTTAFSNLEKLYLKSLPELEMIWKAQTHHSSLQNLTFVNIRYCHKLKYIFSHCIPRSLQELRISQCEGLEQVFGFIEETDGKDITLPHLQTVLLEDLPSLTSFCSRNCSAKLPSWKRIEVRNCPHLTHFMVEPTLVENQAPIPLSNSTSLELKSLPELRCIWKGPTRRVNLQSLKAVKIWECDKLAYLFSPTLAQTLVHLEQLDICYCHSLEHLIKEVENDEEIVPNMHCYPLCWPKFKTLVISNCKSFKYVFPISLAQGLLDLKSVEISDCPQLMQIFDMAKEKDGQDIELPQLQVLTLENLERLSSFCPRNYRVRLPSLKMFNVCRLSHFYSNSQRLTFLSLQDVQLYGFKELVSNVKNLILNRVIYPKNLIPIVDSEGLNELTFLELQDGKELECLIDIAGRGQVSTNAFFNLVELLIESMVGLKMLCKGPFPNGFLQKLEMLETKNCMEMVSLCPVLQNLKEVKVINCGQLQEVFQIDELLCDRDKNQTFLLSNLTHLELDSLLELRCIWKGPTRYVGLLGLKTVEIRCCYRLKYLFSPSLAQSLVLLEQLKINHCDGLQHIVGELESGDAIESDGAHLHPLLLPKLRTLLLENLINLSSFCSDNHLIELPSLESLRVWDCPRLTNFTIQNEVNKQVQLQENQTPVPLLSSTCLDLVSLPQFSCIWKVVNLQRLKTLRIDDFQTTYLFLPTLIQTLVHLEELRIRRCESLEYLIIEAENENELLPNMDCYPLCWPKLKTLEIRSCKSLKYVFPITLGQGLPCLEYVKIIDCPQLMHVFDMAKGKDRQAIVLPQLQIFYLGNVEKLSSFCPGNYFVMLPSLKDFMVGPHGFAFFDFDPPLLSSCLSLEDVELYGFKELLSNAKNLNLIRVIYPKNLIPIVDSEGLNELTFLELKDGKELECLIDTTDQGHVSTTAFFNLADLDIIKMAGFKMLCKGPIPKGFLQKLEKLKLDSLPELKWIWNWPTCYVSLQSLKVVGITGCHSLKYLFSPSLAQSLVLLEELKIDDCDGLQHIIAEWESGDAIESDDAHLHPPFLPKLRALKLKNLINLSSFCSENYLITFSSLEMLDVGNCRKLENLTFQIEANEQAHLKELLLNELPSLKKLTPVGYHLRFPLLWRLQAQGCPKLTVSFSEDLEHVVHAMIEAPQQVENNTMEGFTTMEEIVAVDPPTRNDISWHPGCNNPLPLYINKEKTEDNVTQ